MEEGQAKGEAKDEAQDRKDWTLNLNNPVESVLFAIVVAAVNEGDDFTDESVQLILEGFGMEDLWKQAVELVSEQVAQDEEALDDPEPDDEKE